MMFVNSVKTAIIPKSLKLQILVFEIQIVGIVKVHVEVRLICISRLKIIVHRQRSWRTGYVVTSLIVEVLIAELGESGISCIAKENIDLGRFVVLCT